MVVRITALNWRLNIRKYDHNIITVPISSRNQGGSDVFGLWSSQKGTSDVTCTTRIQQV